MSGRLLERTPTGNERAVGMQLSSASAAPAVREPECPTPARPSSSSAQEALGGDVAVDRSASGASELIFPLVYRQILAIAGRRHDLDDLVQEANEQVLRALPSFEGRSQLSTWTYRICYRTVLKHDRWHRRWLRRFSLTEDGELPEASGPLLVSSDAANELDERARRLHEAIGRLSFKRRVVLVLHDLEGLGIEEIAAVIDLNPLTVRSRLRDGRKDLTRILKEDAYFGDEACGRKGEEE